MCFHLCIIVSGDGLFVSNEAGSLEKRCLDRNLKFLGDRTMWKISYTGFVERCGCILWEYTGYIVCATFSIFSHSSILLSKVRIFIIFCEIFSVSFLNLRMAFFRKRVFFIHRESTTIIYNMMIGTLLGSQSAIPRWQSDGQPSLLSPRYALHTYYSLHSC